MQLKISFVTHNHETCQFSPVSVIKKTVQLRGTLLVLETQVTKDET